MLFDKTSGGSTSLDAANANALSNGKSALVATAAPCHQAPTSVTFSNNNRNSSQSQGACVGEKQQQADAAANDVNDNDDQTDVSDD